MSNSHSSQRSQRTSAQRSTRSQDVPDASTVVASPRRSQRIKKPLKQNLDSEQVVIKDEEETQPSASQFKRRSRHVGIKKIPENREGGQEQGKVQGKVHKEEQEEQEEKREEKQIVKKGGLRRRNQEASHDKQDVLEIKPSNIKGNKTENSDEDHIFDTQEQEKYLLTKADLELLDFKAWQVCEVLGLDGPIKYSNKQEEKRARAAQAAHWDVFDALKVNYLPGTNFLKRAGFSNEFPVSRIDSVITRANIATFMHMLTESRSLMEAADALFKDVIPLGAPKTEELMKIAVDLKSMAILDEMAISTDSGKEFSIKDHLDHHFPESPHNPLGWDSDGDGISGSGQQVQLHNKRRHDEELYLNLCSKRRIAIAGWAEKNEGSFFHLDFTRDELIQQLKDVLKQILQSLPLPLMGKVMKNMPSSAPDPPHIQHRKSDGASGASKQKLSRTSTEDWRNTRQPDSGDETDDESIADKSKSSQTSKPFGQKELLRKLLEKDQGALDAYGNADPLRPHDLLRPTDSDRERDTSIIPYDGPNSPTLTPKRQQPKINKAPSLGRVPSSDKDEENDSYSDGGDNKRRQSNSPRKKQRTHLSQMVSPQREAPEKRLRASRPGGDFLKSLSESAQRMNEIVKDPLPQVYKDVSIMQTDRHSRKSLDSATINRQSKGRSAVRESFPPTGHRSSHAYRDDTNGSGGESSSRWPNKKWDKRDETATRLLFSSPQGSVPISNLRQPLQPQREQRKYIETQKPQSQYKRIRNESIRAEDVRKEGKKIKQERQPILSMSDMENDPSEQVLMQRRDRQVGRRKRESEKDKFGEDAHESPRHNHIQSFTPLPEQYENEPEDEVPRHRLLRSPRKKRRQTLNLNDLPKRRPQKRRRWTEEELKALEEGMERFGTRWNKIGEAYPALTNRDQVQLKDKARTERARRQRAGIPLGVWEDGCTWIREELNDSEGSKTDIADDSE